MTYHIFAGESERDLMVQVNAALEDGWELAGGVAVIHVAWDNARKGYSESGQVWAQAMTLDAK